MKVVNIVYQVPCHQFQGTDHLRGKEWEGVSGFRDGQSPYNLSRFGMGATQDKCSHSVIMCPMLLDKVFYAKSGRSSYMIRNHGQKLGTNTFVLFNNPVPKQTHQSPFLF